MPEKPTVPPLPTEPKDKPRGWQDVFEQIDYSQYEGSPGENVYVWG